MVIICNKIEKLFTSVWVLWVSFFVKCLLKSLNPSYQAIKILVIGSSLGFPGDSAEKNLPEMQEAWDGEDPLKKRVVTHSGVAAWRIPWIEEPGRLQSMSL